MVLTIQLYIVQSKHGWKVAQMCDEVQSATFIKCHEEWNWREQCEKTKAGTRLTSKLHTDKRRAEAFCQPLLSTPAKVTSEPLEHILVGRAGTKKVSKAASVCSGPTRVADHSVTMARRERCSANCLRTQKSVPNRRWRTQRLRFWGNLHFKRNRGKDFLVWKQCLPTRRGCGGGSVGKGACC